MAVNTQIRIRRSATPNNPPSTTDLALGELAINTYDGKLYLKKDVSGTESIVEVGQTATPTPGGSDGQVQYNDGGVMGGTAQLYYDDVNNRVGIGTSTPSEELEVVGNIEALEVIADLRGAILFKAQAGENIAKGQVVYISGISGNTTIVSLADANDAAKMPAFGVASSAANSGNPVDIYTSGILSGLNTSGFAIGAELFVSDTPGVLTDTAPTGEASALQKIAKVTRSDNSAGSIFITGAGRSNAVPNLNTGRLFVGNASNQAVADDTIYVDIANSEVGIGTTNPLAELDVRGVTWSYGAGDGNIVQKLGVLNDNANTPLYSIYTDDAGVSSPFGGDALEFNTGRYSQSIGASRGSAAGSRVRSWQFVAVSDGDERGIDFNIFTQPDSSATGSTTTANTVKISSVVGRDSYINSGNFGIGTNTPSTKFHVNHTVGGDTAIFENDGVANVRVEAGGTNRSSFVLSNGTGTSGAINGVDGGGVQIGYGTNFGSNIALEADSTGNVTIPVKLRTELIDSPANGSFINFDDDGGTGGFPNINHGQGINGTSIASVGGMNFLIDSNDNDIQEFKWLHGTLTAPTEVMRLDGAGALSQLTSVSSTSVSATTVTVGTGGSLQGPATFYIDPAPDDTGEPGGATTDTGTVVILGDLQVNGTTTTINSTVVSIADLNITLADGAATAAAANGAGITIDGANATLTYDSTRDSFEVNKPFNGLNIDTNTNTDPFQISRNGVGTSEVLNIGITDNQAIFNYIEDTSSEGTGAYGSYIFQLSGNEGTSPTVTAALIDETRLSLRTGSSYQIGNSNVLNNSGTYVRLYDPEEAVRIYLGDSADARNYYDNNSHRFRLANNTTNLAELDSTGLRLGGITPTTDLQITSSGVHGILLDPDTTNTANSGRLFFETASGTSGMLGSAGNLSFRRGMVVNSTSGIETMSISGSTGDVSMEGNLTVVGGTAKFNKWESNSTTTDFVQWNTDNLNFETQKLQGSAINTSRTVLDRVFLNNAIEDAGGVFDPGKLNVLAGAKYRFTVAATNGGTDISSSITDAIFEGSSSNQQFTVADPATTEVVITISNITPSQQFTAFVGVTFGNGSFRAKDVKIETFRGSPAAWQTECDLTNQTQNTVVRQVSGNGANGVTAVRYTFKNVANVAGSYFRLNNLFLADYNTSFVEGGYHVGRYHDNDIYGTNTVKDSNSLRFEDNSRIKVGTNDDLQIYHNGSDSVIGTIGPATGDLVLNAGGSGVLRVNGTATTETMIKATENAAVELYYNGLQRLVTSNDGVSIISAQNVAATNLATSVSEAVLQLNGDTGFGTDALWFGKTQTSGQQYIQAANSAGTTAYDIFLNAYGGKVGIGSNTAPVSTLDVTGRITVQDPAVPLAFNQTDQSNGTVGKWWRMPVDGTNLRFDVSLTGDSAFTTYRDVLTLATSGNVTAKGNVTALGGNFIFSATDFLNMDDDTQTITTGTNATVLASTSDIAFQSNTNDGGGGLFTFWTGSAGTGNEVATLNNTTKVFQVGGVVLDNNDDTVVTNHAALRRGSAGELYADAPGHIVMNIDSNNNNTDRYFGISKDADYTNPFFTINESGIIDVVAETNTTNSATGTTLLSLTNDVGIDLEQQKSFIDFKFVDDNLNELPQVRIGAEVGPNGNADSQEKEGEGAFVIYTNNATGATATATGLQERVRVDYQGNVGIGTSNPQRKLTVQTDAASTITQAAFYNADTTDGNGSVFSFRGDTSGVGAATFQEFAAIAGEFDTHDHATRTGSLRFFTGDFNGSGTRMSILGDGKVGIGSLTPNYLLDIEGTTSALLRIHNTNATNVLTSLIAQNDLGIAKFGTQSGYSRIHADTTLTYAANTTTSIFYSSGVEEMRLNGTGLGIGTDNPSVKLSVESANDSIAGKFERGTPTANQVGLQFTAGNTRYFGKGTDDKPYWSSTTNLSLGDALVLDTVTISAGTGLTGGGDLSANRTISVDYAGTDNIIDACPTNLEGTAIATADSILYHDATDNNVKKGLVSDLPFNDYTHPAYTTRSVTTTGVDVLSTFTSDAIGSVTSITTRTLPSASATVTGVVNTGVQTFGGAKTFNSQVTVDKLITASNAVTTEMDIEITDNGNIGATQGLNFYVDIDNNGTGNDFTWRSNARGTDNSTLLLTLDGDNGTITPTGPINTGSEYNTSADINLSATGTPSPAVKFNTNTATDAGFEMAIRAAGEGLDFYEPEDTNKLHMRILDDTGVNAVFGWRTGANDGTLRLDASGNLVAINNITAGGTITFTGLAGATEATAVMINGSGVLSTRALSSGAFAPVATWTLTADSGTNQTVNSGDTVDIAGGTYVSTVVGATDTVTINHNNTTRTNNTSNASPAHGGTFTAIDSVTTNATGHVTAVNTKTVTLPSDNNTDTLQSIANDATNNDRYITFVNSATGAQTAGSNANLRFNPSTGLLSATSKSFDIEHPTKENMRLRYGSLEGPENGVYVRGRLKGTRVIELPDYWTGLVDEDSITVSLTAMGRYNEIWVEKIEDNKVYVDSTYSIDCFYHVFAERKDIDPLTVEYENGDNL